MEKIYSIDLTNMVNEIETLKINLGLLSARVDDLTKPLVVDVKEFAKGDGATYDDAAIMLAQDKALKYNVPLLFTAGNYLIHPSKISIKSNAKWYGTGARIFTRETALYNIMVPIEANAENVEIDGIMFDQMGDALMKPSSQSLLGCHILHAGNYKNLKITNCQLNGYGATLLLTQPYDGYGDKSIISGNKATWQRQVPDYYDASIFNIDGLSATVQNNLALTTKKAGVDDYKAESAFEVHFPMGIISGNVAVNCINGILPVGWPTLFKTYDAAYPKNLLIENNDLSKCVRGIAFWGDRLSTGREIANVTIRKNKISLSFSKKGLQNYYPSVGIGCVNGGADLGTFRNFKIYDNDITTLIEDGLSTNSLDYAPPIDQIGAINLLSNNACIGWEIYNNRIDFPYSTFMIRGAKLIHESIKIHDNKLNNCAYRHGYDALNRKYDALSVFENVKGVCVTTSTITNDIGKAPIAVTKTGLNVIMG